MAIFPRGKIDWYKFYFAGQLIRESSKSTSKTVAKNVENQRRRELKQGFNNVQTRREIRIRQLRDVAEDYLGDYRLRFRGVTFAEYAIGHVVRHLGEKLLIDIDETTVLAYQTARLKEQASPKSINEEVRFLLTMMGNSATSFASGCGRRRSSNCRHGGRSEKHTKPRRRRGWATYPGIHVHPTSGLRSPSL